MIHYEMGHNEPDRATEASLSVFVSVSTNLASGIQGGDSSSGTTAKLSARATMYSE